MLPETDEDFGAKDLVGAVGLGYSAGADGPQVGPGVGFGEAHRAGPLARDQLREVGSPEVVVAMRFEHVDCPLREQQAYGEGEVGRRQGLEEGDTDHPREASSAVGRIERDGSPPGLHVRPVGGDESGRSRDRAIVVADTARDVARLVERSDDVGGEPSGFGEEVHHDAWVGVLPPLEACELFDADDVAQHEVHVPERSAVAGHRVSTCPVGAVCRLGRS